jgi:hypothetical protein
MAKLFNDRMQIVINVEVNISQIDAEVVATTEEIAIVDEDGSERLATAEDIQVSVNAQNELLAAILADSKLRFEWIRSILHEVAEEAVSRLNEARDRDWHEEILSLTTQLSPEAQEYFTMALKNGSFDEATEDLYSTSTGTLIDLHLIGLEESPTEITSNKE